MLGHNAVGKAVGTWGFQFSSASGQGQFVVDTSGKQIPHVSGRERPIRVLFLHTQPSLGADVAIHMMLARTLDRPAVRLWAATGTYEVGTSSCAAWQRIPDLSVRSLNLGRPAAFAPTRGRRLLAQARNLLAMGNVGQLAMFCLRERIDIVHTSERPRDALFGVLLAKLSGAACLIHSHTSYYRHDATRLNDWALRNADAVVGVSRFTATTLVNDALLPPERVFTVHNAIDADVFRPGVPETAVRAMRERLGVPVEAPLIGFVARLSRWKDQAMLLDAFALVHQERPEARLVLVGTNWDTAPDGNGEYLDYLKRRVDALELRESVTFAGSIRAEEMPVFYAAIDMLAHPAVEEPFGLALVEAMACERPVVVVGAGGVPEIIRDGQDGVLVPRGEPAPMAEAILRVLRDTPLRERLGRAGRTRVLEAFIPKHSAAAMLDVYRTVASRRTRESRALKDVLAPSPERGDAGGIIGAPGDVSLSDAEEGDHMSAQLYLVNPPLRKGRTNERAQSGGLGVSRKLKPFEKPIAEVLPHDFLYQAAVAEQAGHRVQFIDLPLEGIYDHARAIEFVRGVVARGLSEEPSAALWLGVRISIPSLHSDLRMANMLKETFPSARVYLFGNVLMTTYRHWIGEAKVDYLFYGEPEAIIAEALAAEDPATVAGIIEVKSYVPREKPGLFEMSSSALYRDWRQMRDISKLPRAAWNLLEMGRYARSGRVSDLGISVPASRGCFMPCTMCPYNLHEGRSMRFRTPEEVLDEIEFLYRTYGVRHIRFRDPNFSANKPHLRTIAQGMLDRHLPIEAAAELSLELLDRDLLELMHRAGIRTILTGVESDDPNCMSSIGQHVKINRILEGKLAICRELGIHVYTFFLIGSPEETWHSVRRTFTFAKKLGGESTMTIMTPFPGTPMYWRALRENLLIRGREMTYEDWNSYTATMRTYKLSLRDVTLARTWARLETYIPYTWNQARNGTLKERARAVLKLAPRVASLLPLRLYAAWKLRREEREDPALRTQSTQSETTASSETVLELERYGAPSAAPTLITATVRRAERTPVSVASGTHADAPPQA